MSEHVAQPYDKNRPYAARLTENRLLNKSGSAKETRHLVVDLGDSGLSYQCGDSLGVFPQNRAEDVAEMLAYLGATGDEPVLLPKAEAPIALREALTQRLSLADPSPKLLTALQAKATGEAKAKLDALLAPEAKETTKAWLAERHFIDVLQEFAPAVRLAPQELVELLKKLMPRLYSIASAPSAHPHEVHLTVAVVRYQTLGKPRIGVCSTYLADRAGLQQPTVPVFVSSSHFKPPFDDSAPMIMVGPGTGIAPFRSFVQDRIARGAPGPMWVFFGDQRQATDYLYGEEFEAWVKDGKLARIDCAWSRDQAQKVYVQDKMLQNGAELWRWLQDGAYFYVCGDAKRMAPDVDAALHTVVRTHGGLDEAGAIAYVKQLKKDKRYQRDVY